ncbi:MAG: hypothetical protein SNJ84_09570, partial [Verrucomicrobiia bacterium]
QRALKIFERHSSLAVVTDVLLIDGSNQPGSLLEIARALAAADINIEYCYCATSPQAKKGLMIMRTSNVEKALRVLNAPTPKPLSRRLPSARKPA